MTTVPDTPALRQRMLDRVDDATVALSIVDWDIEPGDFVCFHMLTLHAAAGGSADGRRALSADGWREDGKKSRAIPTRRE